jgi:hypothetical protein
MEYYCATKKNEILLFLSKCIELENNMLSKVSQVQKDKGSMFSLICGRQKPKDKYIYKYKYNFMYVNKIMYNI